MRDGCSEMLSSDHDISVAHITHMTCGYPHKINRGIISTCMDGQASEVPLYLRNKCYGGESLFFKVWSRVGLPRPSGWPQTHVHMRNINMTQFAKITDYMRTWSCEGDIGEVLGGRELEGEMKCGFE